MLSQDSPSVQVANEFDDAPDESLLAVYREHLRLLRYLATVRFHIPPPDAEALVQEVFTAFIRCARDIDNPRTWLIGAIYNASRHYWRERERTQPLPPNIEQWEDPRAVDADSILERLAVRATLARIGKRCRDLLQRYYFREESIAEISDATDTSPGYVKLLLHLCRKRARALYLTLTKVGA